MDEISTLKIHHKTATCETNIKNFEFFSGNLEEKLIYKFVLLGILMPCDTYVYRIAARYLQDNCNEH